MHMQCDSYAVTPMCVSYADTWPMASLFPCEAVRKSADVIRVDASCLRASDNFAGGKQSGIRSVPMQCISCLEAVLANRGTANFICPCEMLVSLGMILRYGQEASEYWQDKQLCSRLACEPASRGRGSGRQITNGKLRRSEARRQ